MRGQGLKPWTDKEDGHERVLVVSYRRSLVAALPLHPVPGVGPAGQEDVESDREGLRVETPAHSLGKTSVGWTGDGSGSSGLAHD